MKLEVWGFGDVVGEEFDGVVNIVGLLCGIFFVIGDCYCCVYVVGGLDECDGG